MAQGKKLSAKKAEAIVAAYVAKVPTNKILREFEIGISTLTREVRKAGVELRGQLVNRVVVERLPMPERIAKAAELSLKGRSHAHIARTLRVSPSSVARYLAKAKDD